MNNLRGNIRKKIREYLKENRASKTSGEVFNPERGRPVKFDARKYPELSDEFYNLISIAYNEIGGHAKIRSPKDIIDNPDWDYWEGVDIHNSPDFDILFFGQKTNFGIKFSGVGHDGARISKKYYLDSRANNLKDLGYYIEVSNKLAEILIKKYNAPQVTSEKEVEKVLGKKVEWIGKKEDMPGEGWYRRKIGGEYHSKIMLGRPII